MTHTGSKNFGIVKGGQYAKRDPRPYVLRQAALELQERIVAILAGRRKSRKIGCVQMGVTKPLSGPLGLAADLQDARVGFDDSWRTVITPQAKALARMHGVSFQTGDFEPPPAVALRKVG